MDRSITNSGEEGLVAACLADSVSAHLRQPFLQEEEFQWFFAYRLGQRMGTRIQRETRTSMTYLTDGEGYLVSAPQKIRGRTRKPGRIDLTSPHMAIELKFPRGRNQAAYFRTGLQRDTKKLLDLGGDTAKFLLAVVSAGYMTEFMEAVVNCGRNPGFLRVRWIAAFLNEVSVTHVEGEPQGFRDAFVTGLRGPEASR